MFKSRVISFVNGIFIVGIEYSLHRSSKKPKVGSDVRIFVFLFRKLTRIRSRIWSEPFPTPIIEDGTLRYFDDYSLVGFTKKLENLIVVRTFSKEFGLAGLRLGYFIANKNLIDVFSRVIQYPYPLNTLAIESGILALQKANQISTITKQIKKERQRIIDNLRQSGAFDVFNSKANFVLFDAKGADRRIYTALIEQIPLKMF